jgi:hypothetical protein
VFSTADQKVALPFLGVITKEFGSNSIDQRFHLSYRAT